jgi:hypothetical protein
MGIFICHFLYLKKSAVRGWIYFHALRISSDGEGNEGLHGFAFEKTQKVSIVEA